MTQKEKELLLKDFCARLPYGVKCKYQHIQYVENGKLIDINMFGRVNIDGHIKDICDVKPYLFPLSSMTSKHRAELSMLVANEYDMLKSFLIEIEFYHKHHFDYRGLIDKGLAIDATGLNVY